MTHFEYISPTMISRIFLKPYEEIPYTMSSQIRLSKGLCAKFLYRNYLSEITYLSYE